MDVLLHVGSLEQHAAFPLKLICNGNLTGARHAKDIGIPILWFTNINFLEIWSYIHAWDDADLRAIPPLFPSCKSLHISKFQRYVGNIHDIVGVTEVDLHSYTWNARLIRYGSSETLTRLGFHDICGSLD